MFNRHPLPALAICAAVAAVGLAPGGASAGAFGGFGSRSFGGGLLGQSLPPLGQSLPPIGQKTSSAAGNHVNPNLPKGLSSSAATGHVPPYVNPNLPKGFPSAAAGHVPPYV